METPNTRFRRKREDDTPGSSRPGGSQEDDRVVWVHDQRLKRAVLLATEHVELAPPTPTQKPRSICSSARTAASASSRPPRKRPCRPSRSIPSTLNGATGSARQSTSASTSSARLGAASAPSNTAEGEVKLELLLQRFEMLSAPPPTREREVEMLDKGKGKEGISAPISRTGGVLRDTSVNTASPKSHHEGIDGSPVTRSAAAASGSTRSKSSTTGLGPGSGSRSTIAPSPLSARNHRLVPPSRGGQKPFKPPFLAQPTRSSPRRSSAANGHNVIPPSPLRTPLPVPAPTTATRSRMNIHMDMVVETPCRGTVRKHNANVDIGEDDPEGNESFDSFDGMFQEGGPEVEELFRAVDAR